MKTATTRITAAVFAAALWSASTASADMVLKNNPDLAGLSVVTNAMGSSSFFPDACTNFTMEAWIKPTAFQSNADVFSPIFSVTTSNKSGYSRYIFGLRLHKLSLFQATVTSGDRFPVSSADVALDTWTHVAVTHTATEVKFYINGSLDATLTGSFLPPVGEYNNSHLTIGGYHSVVGLNTSSYTTARVFQGSLADVRVWTKARTAEEIAADYQSRLRGDEDGLLLYAPFDDAAGGVARDMATGQRLIAPDTMRFVGDATFPTLSPASPRLVGEGYLASTRTGGNQGASAIVTDVDFANNANGTGPDFTFETWLRVPKQEVNDQWIFSKFAESGDTGWIGLDIRSGTLTPEVVISGQRFTLDEPIDVDRWYHLAATRSGSSYAIYLDGAPAKSGTCRTTGFSASNAAAPVKLLNAGTNKSFGGDVKEMRIWDVARTAAEIAAYYDKKATGREDGLIGCWHMDEGYGSKVRNAATGAEQSVAVGGMGLVRGSFLVLTGQKQTIETDAQLTTSDFTLEAWVRDDSPTPRLGGNGRGYILSQYQSGKDWLSLCFENANKLQPGIRISSNWFLPARSSIKKGEWFHIAATREGNSVKVYVNGSLSTNATYTANLGVPTSAKLTFGALASNDGHVGGIREARAWNYARSQVQIQQTMFGGIVGDETGLVGWWPLDQDASATRIWNRKASNTSEKAIPTGAVWDSDGSPLLALPDQGESAEKAANFGGGWFSVARTGIHVDASDFTFETWVRPDAYPYRESFLFAQWKEGEGNPNRFLMGFRNTGRFGFFIGGTDGSGNVGGWKETDAPIPLGRWTHLAATRSGSTLKLYVNGVLAKTFENYTTLSPWTSDHPHDLTLGGVDGAYAYTSGAYARINNSRSFAGAMREVRVWNVARSAEEIADSFRRQVNRTETGLVGYWPLDGADEDGATRLVNRASGHAVGSIVAGWETVEPLCLKGPPAPFTIVIR